MGILPLWLASRSPRRRELLEAAGCRVHVQPAGVDDGDLVQGAVSPAQWVMALAYLKAQWVATEVAESQTGAVLGADTVCVVDGDVLGQPVDVDSARSMLYRLRGRAHETMTGVCILEAGRPRRMFVDRATVSWGDIDDETIETYLADEGWRGKAGAYNLADRQAAGWPVTCDGDPATVMGLPMRRLHSWLEKIRCG